MTLSMTYGIPVRETNDPFINLAEAAMESASTAASTGLFLVDVIPILKYVPEFVPGAGFQKQARIWRKIQEEFRERPYVASIEAMVFYLCVSIRIALICLFRRPAELDHRSHQWLWVMSTKVIMLIISKR